MPAEMKWETKEDKGKKVNFLSTILEVRPA